MKLIIEKHGGSTKFSRRTGIPVRTVQDWKSGRRSPPVWVERILAEWLKLTSKEK